MDTRTVRGNVGRNATAGLSSLYGDLGVRWKTATFPPRFLYKVFFSASLLLPAISAVRTRREVHPRAQGCNPGTKHAAPLPFTFASTPRSFGAAARAQSRSPQFAHRAGSQLPAEGEGGDRFTRAGGRAGSLDAVSLAAGPTPLAKSRSSAVITSSAARTTQSRYHTFRR